LVDAATDQTLLHFTAPPGLPLDTLRSRLPLASTVAETRPGAYQVRTPELVDALSLVTSWFASAGVTPTSISSERRTLEDVFLELTGEDRRR
jgi:ABC-2 type transport system ATP-binding protein